MRGAHRCRDVQVEVAEHLVHVVHRERDDLGAAAVVAVDRVVHEGELFDDLVAHRRGVRRLDQPAEVGGDPDRGHLGVERAEERRVVAVEVEAVVDARRQDLPVQHEVAALVEAGPLDVRGEERDALGVTRRAHDEIGRHDGAVVEFGVRALRPDEQPGDRAVAVHRIRAVTTPLEEPFGGQTDRAPDDPFHRPAGHQARSFSLNWRTETEPIELSIRRGGCRCPARAGTCSTPVTER